MKECFICHNKNKINYICPICNREYCEIHKYSHICNSKYSNNYKKNNISIRAVFILITEKIKKVILNSKSSSYISFISILVYLLSSLNLSSKLCFYPIISYIIFEPWRIITYIFVHGNFIHLFFNLIALNFFGSILELDVRKYDFIIYYLTCGIGSALIHFIFSNYPLIGSSGAIFGLFGIASILNPNLTILINFFPIKLKYSVIIALFFEIFASLFLFDNISHFSHIGGILIGLVIGYFIKKIKC